MTAQLIPVTELEAVELVNRSIGTDRCVPLVFGTGGSAIHVTGDGSARWALAELLELRGIK